MYGERVVVGIDVGKFFHYVWAEDRETGEVLRRGQVDNREREIRALLVGLADPEDALVVVDQPSNIGALVLRVATSLGFHAAFIPSDAMRREAERQGERSKTDRADAKVICHAAIEAPRLLREVCRDETKLKARALRARDTDLMRDETRAKNRLRAALLELMPEFERALSGERLHSPAVLEALARFGGPWGMRAHRRALRTFFEKRPYKAPLALVEAIEGALGSVSIEPRGAREFEGTLVGGPARDLLRIMEERAAISREIAGLLKDDADFKNLLTMPGIGEKTAAAIVADVDIARFDDAFKLARYMGVAPRVARSGTSVSRTWADRRGNSRLRHAMFCSAFACLRSDPQSYAYYCKKRLEGKTFAAAVLALARKRAKVIYAILRDGKPFEEREWAPKIA